MTDKDNKYASALKFLEYLGENIEISRENKSILQLEKYIQIAEGKKQDKFTNYEKAIFNYFLANAYSYKQKLAYPNRENFPVETLELKKEIIHLRTALRLIQSENDDFNTCQILTNLASLFSHLGRVSEAQEYYNTCLEISPDFAMAIGNKGFALYYYSRLLFDENQQLIFLKEARKLLIKTIGSNDIYQEAKHSFIATIKAIEEMVPNEYLTKEINYSYEHTNKSNDEINYRNWCSDNKLFINPLNDIYKNEIVEHDYLFTPTITLKHDEKPIYQSIFNQIKQEFVTARFFFYESLAFNEPHYSDKDVTLMDLHDYSVYSIHIEKVKMAFRMCYSIFDKIAYLLNLYLDLNHSEKESIT